MAEYNDKFTLDGRVKPYAGVTKKKVLAVKGLVERALKGDKIADATLREAITTSDALFNVAYIQTLNFIPQFDEAPRVWNQVAGVRVVPDFRPVQLYSIFGDLTGPGIGANGEAVRVPEAAPFPHVTVSGIESAYNSMAKHGFAAKFTWEAQVNDTIGFFDGLAEDMLAVSVDTEEAEVFDALINGVGDDRALEGGELPDGTVVLPNARLTPSAIWQAIIEESNREVNGRKIGRASSYRVVVPVGVAEFINYQLRLTMLEIQDGAVTFGNGDQGALNGITVVESARLSGNEWFLLPAPGATRRPVLELLRLRGHEAPELRVKADGGNYIGGGAVSPFEGSFDTDTIDFRFRYPVGAALWDDIYVVKSDGSGTA